MRSHVSLFLLVVTAIGISGCEQKVNVPGKPFPVYKYQTELSDAENTVSCKCSGARELIATNTDPTTSRYAVFRKTTKLANGQFDITTTDRYLRPKESSILACSVESPSETPNCLKTISFDIVKDQAIAGAKMVGFGSVVTTDALTCVGLCNSGSARCLALGKAGAPLVSNFLPLLDAAESKPGTVISKTDLQKAYGLNAASDQCEREGITVSETTIQNIGKNCTIPLASYSSVKLPVDVEMNIPAVLTGDRVTTASLSKVLKNSSSLRYISFSDSATSGALGFFKTPTIRSKDGQKEFDIDLVRLYGGDITSISIIEKEAYIATSNGCMSAVLP